MPSTLKIIMIKSLFHIIAPLFLLVTFAFVNIANAADDTSNIYISVGQPEYLYMQGTAVGGTNNFSVADIEPTGTVPIVSLGTLGFESNVTGDCSLNISTVNDFRLRHTVSNEKLTRFRLRYKGKNLSKSQPVKTFPCNSALTSLNFMAVGIFNSNPEAGVYQDTVTLTVTTQ